MALKNAQLQSLFKQILLWEKKLKTCQEWQHLVSGLFIKVFYKTTTFPRRPLLSGPKSGCLIQVWLYSLLLVWSGIWSVATTKIGFWTLYSEYDQGSDL